MSTGGRSDRSGKSARQIEDEANQSRARIEGLIDQIEARLSPGQLMEQAQSYLRTGPGEFGSNLGAIIKNNPVPVALAGIGLGWLALAGSRNQSRPELDASGFAEDRAEDGEGRGLNFAARSRATSESAQRLAQDAGQRIGQAGDQVRRQAGLAQDQAGHVARQAKDGFLRILTEQPLVVAGVGVALGALLGAALPSTEQEDAIMGEASDDLKQETEALGREQMETVQTTMAEKVDEAAASQPDSPDQARAT